MRHLLIVVFAVPLSAWAQLVHPCGAPGGCVRVGDADNQIQLGGIVKVSPGAPYPDGGNAFIQPMVSGVPLQVLGNQSRTSTQPDVVLGGSNARDGGSAVVAIKSAGYTLWSVSGAGTVSNNGPLQSLGPTGLGKVTTIQALDAGVFSKVGGVSIGGLIAQDAGVATHTCQFGYGAMTTGALAVTYSRAFTSNPQCFCSHVNTTNSNPCVLDASGVPTTTAASFLVASGGSDVVHWMCCGDI